MINQYSSISSEHLYMRCCFTHETLLLVELIATALSFARSAVKIKKTIFINLAKIEYCGHAETKVRNCPSCYYTTLYSSYS